MKPYQPLLIFIGVLYPGQIGIILEMLVVQRKTDVHVPVEQPSEKEEN